MVCFDTFRRLVRWRGASNYGFTLVELLVVIAVIAVLATLGLGAISRMSLSAGTTKSANQMLQIHRAALLWANDNNNWLPRQLGQQWITATYPYLMNGQELPPNQNPFVPPETGANLKGTPFYCPLKDRSKEGTPVRSYAWNWKLEPNWPLPRVRQPSKTMMLVTSRNTSQIDANNLSSISTRCGGKALVVFVDGHLENRALDEIPTSNTNAFFSPE